MAGVRPPQMFSLLAQSDVPVSHLMVQTTYGLIVEATTDGALDVRLADADADDRAAANQEPAAEGQGYRYYIWPDYQTSFVWYKSDWPGNPGDETHVDQDELSQRYGEAWAKALEAWVDKYTRAFEAHECHLGSHEDPFPDKKDRVTWVLEGVLLASWLALQPGVDAVEFDDDAGTATCTLEKNGLAATVGSLLSNWSHT